MDFVALAEPSRRRTQPRLRSPSKVKHPGSSLNAFWVGQNLVHQPRREEDHVSVSRMPTVLVMKRCQRFVVVVVGNRLHGRQASRVAEDYRRCARCCCTPIDARTDRAIVHVVDVACALLIRSKPHLQLGGLYQFLAALRARPYARNPPGADTLRGCLEC